MWHPNVYADGKVCISILHSPGEDPMGYEQGTEVQGSGEGQQEEEKRRRRKKKEKKKVMGIMVVVIGWTRCLLLTIIIRQSLFYCYHMNTNPCYISQLFFLSL